MHAAGLWLEQGCCQAQACKVICNLTILTVWVAPVHVDGYTIIRYAMMALGFDLNLNFVELETFRTPQLRHLQSSSRIVLIPISTPLTLASL